MAVVTQTLASDPDPAARRGSHVLVVEDSKAIASLLCASIAALEGLQAEHAATLAEARRLLGRQPERFFLAVLDLNLPDAANGEIVASVQAHGIPVIVLTGSVEPETRRDMLQRQIVDYVVKRQLAGVEYVVKLVERIHASRDLTVLVVDDSPSFRSYVETLLHNHGYRTVSAANGQAALQLLQVDQSIRLVVTDYNMPVMDGLQMVEQMRRIRSRDQLAIIGLSDSRQSDISPRFLKLGASDFLAKPFELEEFYCRVDQNLDMLRYVQEARDAANRDFLTKAYNRRYFFEHAERLYRRAVDGELRVALAVIDADHFKRINDTHGHLVGDQALKLLAQTLQASAGSNGLVARFGGEEFVCLHLLAQDDNPGPCLEGLRQAVERIELFADGARVPLTVSVGVTEDLAGGLDQMIARADRGVYQAKQAGRNRVVMA
jgi:diguanylate cyclase (GGDEF)-like protein